MARFDLTAVINLQAANIGKFIQEINSKVGNIVSNITVKVPTNASNQVNTLANSMRGITTSTHDANNGLVKFYTNLQSTTEKFGTFVLATAVFRRSLTAFTNGIKDAIAFEREIVKIAQVTGNTTKELYGLQQEITKLSTSLGVSSTKLVDVSLILAQAGLSSKDVKIALESLAKTDLAPTFSDMKNTVEGAIAAMAQFNLEAEDLDSILGSINEVSAKFAVESGDLVSAIRKTGGAFKASGGDLNELLALFTSVRATTRESADSIATGFRTIFTRLQRTSTIDFLSNLGIQLKNAEGLFVGPYEAIRRLSSAMQSIPSTDLRFSQIVEELGGFRQVSKVIPLIQQFETAEKALQVAQAGGNSLTEDSTVAQQALAVQIQKTREEFESMFRTLSANKELQSIARFVLELSKSFANLIESLESVLPLLSTLSAFFIGTSLKQLGRISGIIPHKHDGGKIHRFARGGLVPGSGNSDTVPAMLTPGEFVIRKNSVKKLGVDTLAQMNENKFALGDKVPKSQKTKLPPNITLQEAIDSPTIYDRAQLSQRFGALAVNEITGKTSQQLNRERDAGPGKQAELEKKVAEGRAKSITITQPINAIGLENTLSSGKNYLSNLSRLLSDKNKSQANVVASRLHLSQEDLFIKDKTGNFQAREDIIVSGKVNPSSISPEKADIISSSVKEKFPGFLYDISNRLLPNEISISQEEISKTLDASAIGSLRGMVFEGVIRNIAGEFINESEASNIFDFVSPESINKLSKLTGTQLESPLEAKGKLDSTVIPNLFSKAIRAGFPIERQGFNKGGSVEDVVPALLTPGEYVINKEAAQSIGYGNLSRMNRFGVTGFNRGGLVKLNKGGSPTSGGTSSLNIGSAIGLGIFTQLTTSLTGLDGIVGQLVNSMSNGVIQYTILNSALSSMIPVAEDFSKEVAEISAQRATNTTSRMIKQSQISTESGGNKILKGYLNTTILKMNQASQSSPTGSIPQYLKDDYGLFINLLDESTTKLNGLKAEFKLLNDESQDLTNKYDILTTAQKENVEAIARAERSIKILTPAIAAFNTVGSFLLNQANSNIQSGNAGVGSIAIGTAGESLTTAANTALIIVTVSTALQKFSGILGKVGVSLLNGILGPIGIIGSAIIAGAFAFRSYTQAIEKLNFEKSIEPLNKSLESLGNNSRSLLDEITLVNNSLDIFESRLFASSASGEDLKNAQKKAADASITLQNELNEVLKSFSSFDDLEKTTGKLITRLALFQGIPYDELKSKIQNQIDVNVQATTAQNNMNAALAKFQASLLAFDAINKVMDSILSSMELFRDTMSGVTDVIKNVDFTKGTSFANASLLNNNLLGGVLSSDIMKQLGDVQKIFDTNAIATSMAELLRSPLGADSDTYENTFRDSVQSVTGLKPGDVIFDTLNAKFKGLLPNEGGDSAFMDKLKQDFSGTVKQLEDSLKAVPDLFGKISDVQYKFISSTQNMNKSIVSLASNIQKFDDAINDLQVQEVQSAAFNSGGRSNLNAEELLLGQNILSPLSTLLPQQIAQIIPQPLNAQQAMSAPALPIQARQLLPNVIQQLGTELSTALNERSRLNTDLQNNALNSTTANQLLQDQKDNELKIQTLETALNKIANPANLVAISMKKLQQAQEDYSKTLNAQIAFISGSAEEQDNIIRADILTLKAAQQGNLGGFTSEEKKLIVGRLQQAGESNFAGESGNVLLQKLTGNLPQNDSAIQAAQNELKLALESATKANEALKQSNIDQQTNLVNTITIEFQNLPTRIAAEIKLALQNIQTAQGLLINTKQNAEQQVADAKNQVAGLIGDKNLNEVITNVSNIQQEQNNIDKFSRAVRDLDQLWSGVSIDSSDDIFKDKQAQTKRIAFGAGIPLESLNTGLLDDVDFGVYDVAKKKLEKEIQFATNRKNKIEDGNLNVDIEELKRLQAIINQGQVKGFNTGGIVPGFGNGDTVPAMLTPGEFVLNKKSVQRIGLNNLHKANAQKFASGGSVKSQPMLNSDSLDSVINKFAKSSENLIKSLDNFPREVMHTINGKVEVIINGADVMTRIMPEVQNLVEAKIKDGINNFVKKKFPDIGTV